MNKFYKLFLDDERHPKDVTWIDMPLGPWLIARNYNEFVRMIEEMGLPAIISFDHDLAFEHYPFEPYPDKGKIPYRSFKEKTGYDCAHWLINYCFKKDLKIPPYQVHSMNPIGKENILMVLANAIKFQNALKVGEEKS